MTQHWENVDTEIWPGPRYELDHTVIDGIYEPVGPTATYNFPGWEKIKTLNAGDILFISDHPAGIIMYVETTIIGKDEPYTVVYYQPNGRYIS